MRPYLAAISGLRHYPPAAGLPRLRRRIGQAAELGAALYTGPERGAAARRSRSLIAWPEAPFRGSAESAAIPENSGESRERSIANRFAAVSVRSPLRDRNSTPGKLPAAPPLRRRAALLPAAPRSHPAVPAMGARNGSAAGPATASRRPGAGAASTVPNTSAISWIVIPSGPSNTGTGPVTSITVDSMPTKAGAAVEDKAGGRNSSPALRPRSPAPPSRNAGKGRTRLLGGEGEGLWPAPRILRDRERPLVGLTRPERLADGAAIGRPAARKSFWATGWAGARTATVSSPALASRRHSGTGAPRQNQGQRPGPEPGRRTSCARSSNPASFSASASPGTCTISGLKRGRPFAAKMAATALVIRGVAA